MNILENYALQSAYQSGEKEGVELIEDYSAWNISDCAKEAVERSLLFIQRLTKRNQIKPSSPIKYPFQFQAKFNNAVCNFNPFDENAVEILVSDWKQEMARLSEEYLQSPEYAELQKKNAEEVKALQEETDSLVRNLYNVLQYSDKTYFLVWLKAYAEKTDRVGVDGHFKEVISLLEKAGYRDNQYVGDPEVKTNRTKKLQWLVGQVINCMKNQLPPHPMTVIFADRMLSETNESSTM